jgi:hypothetical protein
MLLMSVSSAAQDSTIVLNVQLKAGTIRELAEMTKSRTDDAHFNVYLKWRTSFKATNHSDNANVTTDTIPTVLVADMYRLLKDIKGSDLDDFSTAINPKRNTNAYLDRLCDAIDAEFLSRDSLRKSRGNRSLRGVD